MRVTLAVGVLPEVAAGPERQVTQLVRALSLAYPELEFTLRASTARRRAQALAGMSRVAPTARQSVSLIPGAVAGRLRLPSERMLAGPFDVYHQLHLDTDPVVPSPRLVVTLNDLVALDWPGVDGRWRTDAGRLLRRAVRIVTTSHAIRADAVRRLRVAPDRITVMPLGVDHSLFRPAGAAPVAAGPRTLLFVGGSTPRKNLPRLLAAVHRLRADPATADVELLLIGPVTRYEQAVREYAPAGLDATALRFGGHIADSALVAQYQHAAALVSPSLAEGFGLPVLEAMACGCPVVTSNRGAQREVAGEAARLVDPTDADAIATGIADVLGAQPAQRESQLAAGIARAAEFTWERAAAILRGVYADVAAG